MVFYHRILGMSQKTIALTGWGETNAESEEEAVRKITQDRTVKIGANERLLITTSIEITPFMHVPINSYLIEARVFQEAVTKAK